MTHRSKHLPVYTMLFGCLLISLGYNMVQYKRILRLESYQTQSWVSPKEYQIIQQEIFRLENNK